MRWLAGAVDVGRRLGLAVLPMAIVACAPSLDWREARPDGSGATMLFPCRPSGRERVVRLADAQVPMQQHSCTAAGATFSLIVAEAGTLERVTPLLAALRAQATANVSGQATPQPLPAISGATFSAQSVRLRIDGKLPDGRPVVEHAAFFVRGTRLYQATVIGKGEPVGAEALDNFFDAIRLH